MSLRAPDLTLFSDKQIELVDEVIQELWASTASAVSRQSHGKAWDIAAHRQLIPYEAVFLSDDPVNETDMARTRELAAQHGWL